MCAAAPSFFFSGRRRQTRCYRDWSSDVCSSDLKGVTADVQERIRSLGLNRWSAIAYTRDKLLFYMIQRRRARRHKREKQEFTFELSYHLTLDRKSVV